MGAESPEKATGLTPVAEIVDWAVSCDRVVVVWGWAGVAGQVDVGRVGACWT